MYILPKGNALSFNVEGTPLKRIQHSIQILRQVVNVVSLLSKVTDRYYIVIHNISWYCRIEWIQSSIVIHYYALNMGYNNLIRLVGAPAPAEKAAFQANKRGV